MFGLSFVQGGFLLAGLAAVIPIMIHLLLKQRARRVDIGSVRFLHRVLKEHNRMRRLREWLLLAARVLTTLLLAMLFARPFFDQTALEAGQREVIYLLDRSASMQSTTNGKPILEKAYAALRGELEQIHEETIVRLALFDSNGVEEIDWKQETKRPEASFAATDYGKAIGWARDALQQSSRPEQEIVVLTDLQQSGIGPTPVGEFPPTIKLRVRDFGHSISKNVATSRAAAVAEEIRPKMPPRIEVDVRNGGPIPIANAKVHLRLEAPDGTQYDDTKTVDLPGAGGETVVFAINKAIPGVYAGRAEIELDDELAFDNRRFVAFEARHPDRLLIVDGEEGSSVYGSETYYLQTALQIGQQSSNRDIPSYEIERMVWDKGKGFPDLTGFRAIVLANVGSFTDTDANRLQAYLSDGGRVLLCCGGKFSRRAAKSLVDAGILPCEMEGTGNLGPYRIAAWDREHPVFRPFSDPQYGDLRRLRFQKISLLKPRARAQVLAETQTRHPLLIESSDGPGKVVVWSSTVDPAWTNWPQGRLFVPMVRQLAAYLTDHHKRKSRISEVVATARPGIVKKSDQIIVANAAPEESELSRVSAEEFRTNLDLPEPQPLSDLTPEQLASLAPPPNSERPEEIWKTVAWILLAWLVLETFLAGRVHA